MKYQDYYNVLGVERSASKDEIRKAYKKLARKYHPDVNKEKGAEDRFKELTEAYEVLGDEEKRQRYDSLGANWKNGQEFRPPPSWEEVFGRGGAQTQYSGGNFQFEGHGAFSDFFNAFFGGQTGFDFDAAGPTQGSMRRAPQKGSDLEAQLTITLYEALKGAKKTLRFELVETQADGRSTRVPKNYSVTVPAGTRPGSVIRLAGQGGESQSGGKSGDLLLRVQVQFPEGIEAHQEDLIKILPVSPWEAVLGEKVAVTIPDGTTLRVKIPEGSQSGTRLRLKEKGFRKRGSSELGDLYLELKIVVPEGQALSADEKALYEQLKAVSQFQPRHS